MKTLFGLLFVALFVIFLGVMLSIGIIGWAIVIWTFGVNPLWGAIALIAWLLIIRLSKPLVSVSIKK